MIGSARFNLFRLLDLGPPPITAPSGVSVTSTTTTVINISWVNGDGTKDIEVFEDGMFLTTLSAGTTTYSRTGLTANISKSLKVRHVDGSDTSAFSNTVSGTTKPSAPTGLTAVALDSSSIQLTWTNTHPSLDIWIYVDSVYLTTKPAGSTSHTHSSLTPSTLYAYDIYHYNAGGLSAADSDSATTQAVGPSAPPSSLTAENVASGQIKLDWTIGDATAQTVIYRDGIPIQTVAAGVDTYSPFGHSAGTAYSFFVRHLKSSVESASSNTANITTLQVTTNVVTGNDGADTIQWSWAITGTLPSGIVGELDWFDDQNNSGGVVVNPTDTTTSHEYDVTVFGYDVAIGGATTIRVDYTINIKSALGVTLASLTAHDPVKANIIS